MVNILPGEWTVTSDGATWAAKAAGPNDDGRAEHHYIVRTPKPRI